MPATTPVDEEWFACSDSAPSEDSSDFDYTFTAEEPAFSERGATASHCNDIFVQHTFKRPTQAFLAASEDLALTSSTMSAPLANQTTEFFELSPR